MGYSPLGCVERGLRKVFYTYGLWVGRHPLICLVLPVLCTGLAITGVVRFREESRVWWTYAPLNAPAHQEHAAFRRFFHEEGSQLHYLVVGVWARDKGNLLRDGYLEEVVKELDYIQGNVSITAQGKRLHYEHLCGRHCDSADIIRVFSRLYRRPDFRTSPNFRLSWPMLTLFEDQFYIGPILGDVSMDQFGIIDNVGVILLRFFSTVYSEKEKQNFIDWQWAVTKHVLEDRSPLIRGAVFSDDIVSAEVLRNGLYLTPYVTLSVAFIFIFVFCANLSRNPVESKPWESVAAIVCPGLAIFTAFGVLLGLDQPYIALYAVVPFLVLAIGVDDAFIILHAWRKSLPSQSVPERMAETLSEAGPSITMTSLTNAASFLIGATSLTPGIHGFCLCTAVAISVDFVYQITFFVAAVVLGGQREAAGRNAFLPCLPGATSRVSATEARPRPKLRKTLSTASERFAETWMCKFFTAYAEIVTGRVVKLVVGIALVVYWALSAYGFSSMDVEMSPEKVILEDSPLMDFFHHVLPRRGGQAFFFVEAPPDFRHHRQLQGFMSFVGNLEALPRAIGHNSTNLWIRPYLEYLSFAATDPLAEFYEHLSGWLADRPHYARFLRLNESAIGDAPGPHSLTAFYFTTGFFDAVEWANRADTASKFRAAAAQFPQWSITHYQFDVFYIDQQLSIKSVTVWTVGVALGVMCLICLLFIPSLSSVLAATAAMLSINLGVFGLLNAWDVDLDPISMITILMSVGFSVDFTCHISYHYYKSEVREPTQRLTDALVSIGWPMIQAGSSTLMGVVVLAIPRSYMSLVFIKTASLVILLGLIHGLLILPVILTSIPACSRPEEVVTTADCPPCQGRPARRSSCGCFGGHSSSSSIRTFPSSNESPSPPGTILPPSAHSRLHRVLAKGLSLPLPPPISSPPKPPVEAQSKGVKRKERKNSCP